MRLTDQQSGLITRYLRDVALALDPDLPRAQCEAALSRIEALIDRQLRLYKKDALETADVEAVLLRLGPPEAQAAAATKASAAKAAPTGRVWLGVCHAAADRFGVPVLAIRLIFAALGPFGVVAYLFAYAEGRYLSRTLPREPVSWPRVGLRAGGAFVALLLLRWAADYAVDGLRHGLERFANRPMPPLGSWGWLQYEGPFLFVLAFFCAIPLAVLSGLPVPPGWDHTLKRCAQAVIALYGIALSFGIASVIVGVVLDFVGEFAI